ncbi:MAG: hypothetical protein AB1611_19620 [bacterium]
MRFVEGHCFELKGEEVALFAREGQTSRIERCTGTYHRAEDEEVLIFREWKREQDHGYNHNHTHACDLDHGHVYINKEANA